MAKLHTDKEKYGVSVAARIDHELAHQIADRADRLRLTFAKMVGMLIARGFDPKEPIKVENREEIERLEEELENVIAALEVLRAKDASYPERTAQFVKAIARSEEEQAQYINKFKTIRDGLLAERSAD